MTAQRHCRTCGKLLTEHGPNDACRRVYTRPDNAYTQRQAKHLIKHWRTTGDAR